MGNWATLRNVERNDALIRLNPAAVSDYIYKLWDANGYMPNDWSPASKRAGRLENLFAKFPSPPKWAALILR